MNEFDDEEEDRKRYPVRETPIMHAAARTLVGAASTLSDMEQQLVGGDLSQLTAANRSARDAVQRAIQFLVLGGARASDRIPLPPRRELASTPATANLLIALNEAVCAAEMVDAERGQTIPEDYTLKSGETRGTGWAETINELALRLKSEVNGFK